MKHLIDKDALVAEIERRRDYYKRNPLLVNAKYCIDEDNAILKFLDTLEVKEVDFEEEFNNYAKDILACDVQFQPFTHLYNCAKYFYELGLKAQKGGMIEALRTEYEKGRADVIAKACQFLNDYQEYPDHDISPTQLMGAFKDYLSK